MVTNIEVSSSDLHYKGVMYQAIYKRLKRVGYKGDKIKRAEQEAQDKMERRIAKRNQGLLESVN